MSVFIIEYTTLINGVETTTYHSNISVNEDLAAMNVYKEHLETNIKLAKRFYEKDEAIRIGNLFERSRHEFLIKTLKR